MSTVKEGVDDEGLYSRQKIMLGERAMKSMAQSTVLIFGLGGLGVEGSKLTLDGSAVILTETARLRSKQVVSRKDAMV